MSKAEIELLALKEKVETLKNFQSIQILLESMGFFALNELYETYAATTDAVSSTTESFVGGIIQSFKEMIAINKKQQQRSSNIAILKGFVPA